MIGVSEAAAELLARRKGRTHLHDYILYTKSDYISSWFSRTVCNALDQFIADVQAGKRPILVLQAPPQSGKSQIVSRQLPAYLLSRFPEWRIGAASYADSLANNMAQAVRINLASPEHQRLFPSPELKRKFALDRMGEFTSPIGTGSYIGVGVGAGLTGRPVDLGIIDDPTKGESEALSETVKESHWNWYQSVFTTRLSQNSGQIIMATSWSLDDLPGRILEMYRGNPRLKHLRFPAINLPNEVGYDPELPSGALVPELHSLVKLYEDKAGKSDYWWSALYQQSPHALGGNVFKECGLRYYTTLPERFDKVIQSWDCTFKDTAGTDYVVGQVWGKSGANAYLINQVRERMSFTATIQAILNFHAKYPQARTILIEDKANGPAVIDILKHAVPGVLAVEPDGSKIARAHAMTSYWEAGNIYLPHDSIAPWMPEFRREVTVFPAAAHDDQVDGMTQAIRYLYPPYGRLMIAQGVIDAAMAWRG